MKRAQRASHRPGVSAQPVRIDRLAHDELRDERTLVTGRNRGGDAEARRRLVRDPLGRAVDAEQRRVLAGQAQHVVTVAEPHTKVAVRDAALERHGLTAQRPESPRELVHDPGQIGHGCETYRLRLASYTFTP